MHRKSCKTCHFNEELPSPRGVRVASLFQIMMDRLHGYSCRPREGCGLHPEKGLKLRKEAELPSP